ncbi:hypothetical protein SAMD00019534_005370, partial [Acytostelium subglobosum LB1]|uniref:hypothetical protein n=1 Tax=Acytostelium subglobosum LB1 TaxID=1410327 RepID=UPI0006450ABB
MSNQLCSNHSFKFITVDKGYDCGFFFNPSRVENYFSYWLTESCTDECRQALIRKYKEYNAWARNCVTILESIKLGAKDMPKSYYDYVMYVGGEMDKEVEPDGSKQFEDTFLIRPLKKEDFVKNWILAMEDRDTRIEQLEKQLEDAVVALCHKRKREEDQDYKQ